LLDEFPNVGKSSDIVKSFIYLRSAQAEYRGIHVHIFPSREFRVEARTQFQQSSDTTVSFNAARGRRKRAADELEQGGFAGAILSHDPDCFTFPYLKRNISERPELPEILLGRPAQQALQSRDYKLLEAIAGHPINLVALGKIPDVNGYFGWAADCSGIDFFPDLPFLLRLQ
jgi:hypothetical protein